MDLQIIKNDELTVVISPIAAELNSIQDKSGTEYLWQGDPPYWDRRAINLFPYVGRLTDGCYIYKGKRYDMSIHGFLQETKMSVEAKTEDSVCFLLRETQETLKIYPFPFELRISYTLKEYLMEICFDVLNTGEECMFFGIGGHPGFRVPLEPGLDFEDYYLEFAEKCSPVLVGFSETCFPNGEDREYPLKDGKIIHLTHSLFDDDAILLKNTHRKVSLKSARRQNDGEQNRKGVTVTYPDMQYIGFWHTTKSDAPFICIEPWASLPSRDGIVEDFETQPSLISLDPGEHYINKWSIEIHP